MPPVTESTLDSADISSIPECDYKSVDTIALALSQLMSQSSPRVFLPNLSTLTAKKTPIPILNLFKSCLLYICMVTNMDPEPQQL